MIKIVETEDDLEKLYNHLKTCSQIGIDTEGDGMYCFQEKVCLIQISDGKTDWIIDPLNIKNTERLSSLFFDPEIKKIFHGGDYDIKSLYRDYGIVVNNMFDTEIGARFAGFAHSGLDHILMEFFNVKTEKKYQKKNWGIRPLDFGMLNYAAMDSRYLIEITYILEEKLKKLGRLSWALEESNKLSKSRFIKRNEKPYFLSVKGAGKLDPRGLAILEGLLKFRYYIARKFDKPLYKIIPNKVLLKISEKKPCSDAELQNIISKGYHKRFGRQISDIIKKAMAIPEANLSEYPRTREERSFGPKAALRVKKLKDWRNSKAKELGLDPGLIINNATLTEIAEKKPSSYENLNTFQSMKCWQKKEFGKELIKVVSK